MTFFWGKDKGRKRHKRRVDDRRGGKGKSFRMGGVEGEGREKGGGGGGLRRGKERERGDGEVS